MEQDDRSGSGEAQFWTCQRDALGNGPRRRVGLLASFHGGYQAFMKGVELLGEDQRARP